MDTFGYSGFLTQLLADRFEILLSQRRVLKELLSKELLHMAVFMGKQLETQLGGHLTTRLEAINKALTMLKLQYPDYAKLLERRYIEHVALRLEAAEFHEMLDNSLISREVYYDLERAIDDAAGELGEKPQLDLGLDPRKLLVRVPFFADLPEGKIDEIARLLRSHLALPGETIISKGDVGDRMFFISSGCVEVEITGKPVPLGSGDFFGEIALLREVPRVANVVAHGYCNLLVLRAKDFNQFLDKQPELRKTLEQVAQQRLGENLERE